jgi:hypothetical protein
MKSGRSIVELAQELQARAAAKRDIVASTDRLHVVHDGRPDGAGSSGVLLEVEGDSTYEMTRHTHRQIASWAGVPTAYYERMLAEAKPLLTQNVNHWLHTDNAARRMVRTLDGTARAFLSDRYRRLDNEDVAEAALPVLLESDDIQIVSSEVTDSKLYIKAVFPRVVEEVRKGDVVQAGVVISNSEIGLGSLSVVPLVYRLVCLNGMIAADAAWRKYHVGRLIDASDDLSVYRDETIAADDRALMMKLQDVVRAASGDAFRAVVERMREATEGPTVRSPVKAVEVLGRTVGLRGPEQESVLERLIRGQDYSRYGMMNAVTNLANDALDYDRATELESLGGRVLTLAPEQWRQVAEAA